MPPPDESVHSIDINGKIARKASGYARDHIREGTTQLINNTYDIDKRRALAKALTDIRDDSRYDILLLSIDDVVRRFEQRVADCKKFSIGNCYELALMALDYMINDHPEVNAEVFRIEGGDHAFLVIGRQVNSDPSDPETWGDVAYICDPWSDKVYPAADYKSKLKNYYSEMVPESRSPINLIEDFNTEKHKLMPIPKHNTTHILSETAQANSNLLIIYSSMTERVLSIFDDLITDLEKISTRMIREYGADDPKLKIIEKKLTEIKLITSELRNDFTQCENTINSAKGSNSYHQSNVVSNDIQRTMKDTLSRYRSKTMLSDPESRDLHRYNNSDTLRSKILQFFKIKPKSSRDYKNALEKSEEGLEALSDLVQRSFRGGPKK